MREEKNEMLGTNGGVKKESLVTILEDINISAFLDNWGPRNVMQVYNPEINMQGLFVIDNIIKGPGLGKIKIAPTITPREVYETARTMTWCCAVMDLSLGGAAAGIRGDPETVDKAGFIRSFAKNISPYIPDKFIAAPGQGIGQAEMKVFVDEIGDIHGAAGKPAEIGGIPFELGVVGLGVGVAIETGMEIGGEVLDIPSDLKEVRVAIQGIENDCCKLAKYLTSKGARVVGLSDDEGAIYKAEGVDINKLLTYQAMGSAKSPLKYFKDTKMLPKEDIAKMDCDVFVLRSSCNTVLEKNVASLKAKCVVEASENAINALTDQMLSKKQVLVIPDIITMGGGAVSAYCELNKNSSERAFSIIEKKVKGITKKSLQQSLEQGIPLRRVVKEMAKEKLIEAKEGAE